MNNISISNVFIADTFIKRFLGYMFRKKPHHEAIMIMPCNSIHTFFMKFHIDVLFLDEEMKVIKKLENLKGGRIILPVRGAKSVIEAGASSFSKIKVGDYIYMG